MNESRELFPYLQRLVPIILRVVYSLLRGVKMQIDDGQKQT
jgi:hypothetical protein